MARAEAAERERDELRRFREAAIKAVDVYEKEAEEWQALVTSLRAQVAAQAEALAGLRQTLMALDAALEKAWSNRGVFSCVPSHDSRCPASLPGSVPAWSGVPCECGANELQAAVAQMGAALAAVGGTSGGTSPGEPKSVDSRPETTRGDSEPLGSS